MKKFKILLCALSMVLIAACLSSCAMFEGLLNTGKAELTIVYPEETETVKVSVDKLTSITPKYEVGKVLMGYYEANEAKGIRYFDAYGTMVGEWKSHYPNKLYAVYEDIDLEYVFKSKVGADEDPQTLSGGILGQASFNEIDFGNVKDEKNSEYLKMVIDQNSFVDVIVTAHVLVKSSTKSSVTMKIKVGAEDLASTSIATGSGDWEEGSVSARISSKQFYGDNNVYVPIRFDATGSIFSTPEALFKNIYYTVSFALPETK